MMHSDKDNLQDNYDELHEHCTNCYNLKKCSISKAISFCPILFCSLGCGSRFHECKSKEHHLLCSEVKVPCLNKEYGCPFKMERKSLGVHLQRCPASTIYCVMQWKQYFTPQFGKTYQHYRKRKFSCDISSPLTDAQSVMKTRDQEADDYECYSGKKVKLPHPFHSRVGENEDLLFTDQGISIDDYVSDGFVSKQDHLEYLRNLNLTFTKYNRVGKKIHSGKSLKLSMVAREAIDSYQYPTRFLGLGPKLQDLEAEGFHLSQCAQIFRRDQYPSHYKDIHCKIDENLMQQCPLAQYGCTYSELRLNPRPPGSRIIYSKRLQSFGIQPPPNAFSDLNRSSSQEDALSLFDLPIELVYHIIRFLDNFSLYNLAATSKKMRQLCQGLVTKNGIVTLHWHKIDRHWKVAHKAWSFTPSFSPIEHWDFGNLGSMANHLKSCSYFTRVKQKHPMPQLGDPASYVDIIKRINVSEGNLHHHCLSCFNIDRCNARPLEGIGCKIVACLFQCGFRFHSCKSIEHQELCENRTVACINAYYGCPFVMPRKMLGKHLATCPASCVHCESDTCLDLRSAMSVAQDLINKKKQMRIQLLVSSSLEHPEKFVSKQISSQRDAKITAFKLLSSPIYYSVNSENSIDAEKVNALTLSIIDVQCDDSEGNRWNFNDDLSVEQLRSLSFHCNSYDKKGNVDVLKTNATFTCDEKWLNLECDNPLLLDCKPNEVDGKSPYSRFHFQCNKVFRRQEYPVHFKQAHCDNLDAFHKEYVFCPLAQYGCVFSTNRFYPSVNESTEENSAFSINNGTQFDLAQLPMKVFLLISHFLDGVSLQKLAMTSKQLRDICRSLVAERGIVTFLWEKHRSNEAVSWKISKKRWFFSEHNTMDVVQTFEHIKIISKHLESCPFFGRLKDPPCSPGGYKKVH